jgi:hypothetical protein
LKNQLTIYMRKIRMKCCLLLFLVFNLQQFNSFSEIYKNAGEQLSANSKMQTVPEGCTVFTISREGKVFFGGNDDYIDPDSYYWVDRGDSANYGVIWIGQPDNVQQGVNEKGLAYDANGLPRVEVNSHPERTPVNGGYTDYPIRIMHECSSVAEVIEWVKTHQWHSYMHDQMQFADATGDAVIISAGADGEVVFTRKPEGDGFLVSTNFNVANPGNSYSYPCWRYDMANRMLGELIENKKDLNINDATGVLNAVHMEKGTSWTIESMAADLVNGIVCLYFYYQFDKPVVLNVRDELSNPRAACPFSKLFPEEVQKEAARRYKHALAAGRLTRNLGIAWAVIVLISIVSFISLSADRNKGLRFWLPAVVVLGPLAILIRFITRKFKKKSLWPAALTESVGDVIPVTVTYTVALTVIILLTVSKGTSTLFQLAMMFGLPFFGGWLIFQGILAASVNNEKPVRFFFRRLPHVLVSTLLGLAGIIPVAMPMSNHSIKSLNMNQLMPLSPWPVMIWWAIVVLGSVIGMILIFLYEYWAVKRGLKAWIILAGSDVDSASPKWSKLWWWIPASVVILLAGLIAAVKFLN